VRGTGVLERTILALRAGSVNPRRAGGRNLVSALLAKRDRDGSFDGLTNLTAFGVLALRAGGLPRTHTTIRSAAAFIARQQNRDGGFGYGRKGSRSGIDETAATIQALVAAGRSASRGPVARAVTFLRRHQNLDGGFGGSAGAASNAQSTAFAIQGLVASGRDPDRVTRQGSRTPLAYLRSLTTSDGSVRYSRTSRQSPVWVTAQALAALARKPLPIRPG
jgi:energy-coupling factor transport system substrate-specific component